jgi:hypothetical protein
LRWNDLTKPERRLWKAFPEGRRVVLGTGDAEHGAHWGPERTVRAEVIRALLVRSEISTRAGVPAVRLNGARIVGTLDLRFASVAYALSLRDCHFDSKLDLHGVQSREIDLAGSHLLGGFRASTAHIDGHLLLDHARVEKSVRLIATHIAGALFMNGARLGDGSPYPARPAFEADMLKVDADILCRDGFRSHGEMRLPGARIGDTLDLEGAKLLNGGERALEAPRITVGGDLLCHNGFVSEGEIDLDGAVVEGRLVLDDAHLVQPTAYALRAARLTVKGETRCAAGFVAEGEIHLLNARLCGPFVLDGARLLNPGRIALHASGLSADGMYCRMNFTARGDIRLSGADITGPLDFSNARLTDGATLSLACWWLTARELILLFAEPVSGIIDLRYARIGLIHHAPHAPPTELRIDGLTYNSIAPSANSRTGLEWLGRAPQGFRPQPYEQLAETYRRHGHEAYAREVLLAKERRRRSTLPRPARAWGYLQDMMVGYGYRPWRAAGWLTALLVAGTTVFHLNPPVPVDARRAPPFNPFVYTTDLLVPIIDFGQRRAYVPAGGWEWLAYGLIVLGWILATTIAAGITHALRRR